VKSAAEMLMRRVKDAWTKALKDAGWRARKLAKGVRKDAFRHVLLARRRGGTLYRQAAKAVGYPEPAVLDHVVVSLTSFPLRIGKAHHVVSSLLDQSVQPGKVVLYLPEAEFPERAIPRALSRLESDRFEIRFVSENLRPHNKLTHAIADFPGAWIATADDDRLYPLHWLERLLDAAAETPRTVICTIGLKMTVGSNRFGSYRDWPLDLSPKPSYLLFPVGSWGTLYPPGSLHPLVDQRDLAQKLAPLNDDVWFKAMTLMRNMPCRACGKSGLMPDLHFKKNVRLWDLNQRGILIDEAVSKVFGHLGLTPDKILAQEAGARHQPPAEFLDAGQAMSG
jgi:hypothetical protein